MILRFRLLKNSIKQYNIYKKRALWLFFVYGGERYEQEGTLTEKGWSDKIGLLIFAIRITKWILEIYKEKKGGTTAWQSGSRCLKK